MSAQQAVSRSRRPGPWESSWRILHRECNLQKGREQRSQIMRSNSGAKRRLIAGESAVTTKYCPSGLERLSPGASMLVRRAGSPGNLHCSMFPANKTMYLFHRACMIEGILAAAIYKWLDDCNIQSSDLSSPPLFDGNPFTYLFEKFECESESEVSNHDGSLNSPTLNRAESLLDKVRSAGSIIRT